MSQLGLKPKLSRGTVAMPTTTYVNVAKCLRVYQYRYFHGTCFRIPPGACAKVASDMGLGSGFHWVLQFPLPGTTG